MRTKDSNKNEKTKIAKLKQEIKTYQLLTNLDARKIKKLKKENQTLYNRMSKRISNLETVVMSTIKILEKAI